MHKHDFDLIAQLAEGSLVGGDLQSAQRTLAACEDCRAEFEAQTLALEVLGEAQPARLTEFERVRLHREVAQATLAPLPQMNPRTAWLPKLAVAAVAVAFVGVVGVGLNSLGADGPSDVAAQAPQAEEGAATAGAGKLPPAEESMAAAEAQSGSVPLQGAEDFATAAFVPPVLPLNLGVIDREAVDALTFERSAPGEVPERAADQSPLEPFPFACVGAAVGVYGEESELRLAGVAVLDGEPVEVLGFGNQMFVFDPKTCDLLFGTGSP